GRSSGGTWLNPKASAPLIIRSGPMVSAPISANDVLQDTARIVKSVPPQTAPPKLDNGRVVCGGVYELVTGYDGESGVTVPVSSPVEAVTVLKVDPGKNRSS